MRLKLTPLLIGLIAFMFIDVFTADAQVAKKNEVISLRDGLKEMLQGHGAASLKKVTITPDEAQLAEMKKRGVEARGSYTVYQGLDGDGALVGAVFIVDEEGKEGPLQVLVAMNPAGDVYDAGFTVFGEDKGKSAMGWQFLKQFIGKKTADDITVGKDIDGVSGATWTSTSVTLAIKRAIVLNDVFF